MCCIKLLIVVFVVGGLFVLAVYMFIEGVRISLQANRSIAGGVKRFAVCLLIIVLIGCFSHPFVFFVTHHALPPNVKNIEKIAIGMTKSEIRSIMGGPTYTIEHEKETEWFYWYEIMQETGHVLLFDENGVLVNIRTIVAR